jgi:hypothetical protein
MPRLLVVPTRRFSSSEGSQGARGRDVQLGDDRDPNVIDATRAPVPRVSRTPPNGWCLPCCVPDEIAAGMASARQGGGKRRGDSATAALSAELRSYTKLSLRAATASWEIWPPLHWRDRQRRCLARTDPAHWGKPTWIQKRIRFAVTVGDLQREVFVEGGALDRFPTVIFPLPHCAFSNRRGRQSCPLNGPKREPPLQRGGFGRGPPAWGDEGVG